MVQSRLANICEMAIFELDSLFMMQLTDITIPPAASTTLRKNAKSDKVSYSVNPGAPIALT